MARKGLTALSIENMKPAAVRREIPDGKSRGLYLVLQPSGHRSWCVRYRRPDSGMPAKLTLGNGSMTLAAARAAAATAMLEVERGLDPAKARKTAKVEAAKAKADTLAAIAENYLGREGPKLRTLKQRRNIFERLVYPELGDKPIGEIRRRDITALLDKVEDDHGSRTADVCLAAVRKLMNWHATRDDDFKSPIVRGMGRAKPAAERARDRTLTDDELRRVWKAAGDVAGPFGALVRFLLLTAARRNEAADMRWSELSGSDWTLPAIRNKIKQDLVRPLSDAAMAVLADLPRFDGCEFVFTSRGRRPTRDFSRTKRELEAKSGVAGWTLHDLRRTARSLMSRASVNPDHAERCLGHKIGGIRQTYDRHEYHAEKKRAFEALAVLVERIVDPRDNVTALRG